MNVVDLGECRDLLRDWDKIRQDILRGKIKAYSLTVRNEADDETIYVGGVFRTDSTAAAKAGMRASWEMTKATDLADSTEGEPPAFANSN